MKIVVLDGYTANPGDISWGGLESLGELTVYDRTPEADIVSRVGDAEAIIINKTELPRRIIEQFSSVKYIGLLATGYNVVDIEAAKEKNIVVANVPDYSTDSVAQMVFALLLEVCHRVEKHSEAVHRGEWSGQEDFCLWKYPLIELAGKTMGIVGYGNIGKRVAKIAKAFGMSVLAQNRSPISTADEDGVKEVELDELLRSSDVVSLHCPLFPETRGMINEKNLSLMKKNAILINTARGALVDEKALAKALREGSIYAAAVDVVTEEPIPITSPLLKRDNCLITPHIAWAPQESRIRLLQAVTENLAAYLAGKPQNVVN